MPQASSDLRDEWPNDGAAIRFLQAQGYVLRRDWIWEWPKPPRAATPQEIRAVTYLIDEWDFGSTSNPGLEPVA